MAPSFRSPDAPLPVSPTYYRSLARPHARARSGRLGVYVTLGTIFNRASGDLFDRLLTGLADLDADVIATVGRGMDPAQFGPQPSNVRLAQFVPQGEVLPTVDLVVSHGGSGSLMAALAHGLPSLVVPLGADQPHNAARAQELGLAVTLDAATTTPDEIGRSARAVVADRDVRTRCAAVAHELHALPDASTAVAALTDLV